MNFSEYQSLREEVDLIAKLALNDLSAREEVAYRVEFFENQARLGFARVPDMFEPTDIDGKPLYIIGINKNQTKEQLEDTVIHEICHIVDHYRNGNFNHGPKWKNLMRQCGANPEATTKLSFEESQRIVGDFLWILYDNGKPLQGYKRKPTRMIRAIEWAKSKNRSTIRLSDKTEITPILRNTRTGEEYRIS